jgi:hypothetical protein
LVQAGQAPQALQLVGTTPSLQLLRLQLAVVVVVTAAVGKHRRRAVQVAVVHILKQAQAVHLGKEMLAAMVLRVMAQAVVVLELLVQMHQEQAGRVVLVLLAA